MAWLFALLCVLTSCSVIAVVCKVSRARCVPDINTMCMVEGTHPQTDIDWACAHMNCIQGHWFRMVHGLSEHVNSGY